MKNKFHKLLYLGICIIIVFVIIVLIIIFSNKDRFADKCPETCPNGYICPPGCIDCGPSHSPSPPGPPGPSPPSPGPPSPGPDDTFTNTSNYKLIHEIKLKNNNPTCKDSLLEPEIVNNWLPKMKDTTGQFSTNYPVGYNYNTNIFIILNQSDIDNNVKSGLNKLWSNCGFPYEVYGSKSCNIGAYNWGPSTLLFVKSGTYDLGSIKDNLARYFVSIYGLVDGVKLNNININNGQWSNNIDNNFFMTIQNCIIDNGESNNFNFMTSQGTSLIKCEIHNIINVGSGSPGYMRDCNLLKTVNGDEDPHGCQQYLFNRCKINDEFIRQTKKQYIFGMLNCKGNGVKHSSISCNSSNGNYIGEKTADDYVNPNVNYDDETIKNEEFVSIDSKGVYKYTETSDSDITKSKSKLYWKYIVILDQSNINSIKFKQGHCYILPGGNYYINRNITIPSKSIIYGLGFAILIPTYKSIYRSVIIMNDNSYICNCIIYAPAKNLSNNILFLNNNCKLYNTHTRILTIHSNLIHEGSMIKVYGNKNYLEHSWEWIADHDRCVPCNPCTYDKHNYGINIIGQLNTFVGMFVEHQYCPINIAGNKNKIIWSQGEGYYVTGSPYYLNIEASVTDLIYVMAGIYAINQPFTQSAINFNKKPEMSQIENNIITNFNGISLQDILVTGWGQAGKFPIISILDKYYTNITMKPQQIAYICNLANIIDSS